MTNDNYIPHETADEALNFYEAQGQAALENERWMISVAAARKMADESFAVGVAVGRAQKLCDQIEAEYGF